jgi:hypothetical protein
MSVYVGIDVHRLALAGARRGGGRGADVTFLEETEVGRAAKQCGSRPATVRAYPISLAARMIPIRSSSGKLASPSPAAVIKLPKYAALSTFRQGNRRLQDRWLAWERPAPGARNGSADMHHRPFGRKEKTYGNNISAAM